MHRSAYRFVATVLRLAALDITYSRGRLMNSFARAVWPMHSNGVTGVTTIRQATTVVGSYVSQSVSRSWVNRLTFSNHDAHVVSRLVRLLWIRRRLRSRVGIVDRGKSYKKRLVLCVTDPGCLMTESCFLACRSHLVIEAHTHTHKYGS